MISGKAEIHLKHIFSNRVGAIMRLIPKKLGETGKVGLKLLRNR